MCEGVANRASAESHSNVTPFLFHFPSQPNSPQTPLIYFLTDFAAIWVFATPSLHTISTPQGVIPPVRLEGDSMLSFPLGETSL